MLLFCGVGCAGAIVAAGIAGHIAVYISQNWDDTNNTICHPEVLYPPIYTDQQAENDCKFLETCSTDYLNIQLFLNLFSYYSIFRFGLGDFRVYFDVLQHRSRSGQRNSPSLHRCSNDRT